MIRYPVNTLTSSPSQSHRQVRPSTRARSRGGRALVRVNLRPRERFERPHRASRFPAPSPTSLPGHPSRRPAHVCQCRDGRRVPLAPDSTSRCRLGSVRGPFPASRAGARGFPPPGPLPSAERQGRRGTEERAPESEQRQKGYIIGAFQRLMGSHWGRYANSSETDCVIPGQGAIAILADGKRQRGGSLPPAERQSRRGPDPAQRRPLRDQRRRFRTRMRVRTRSGRGAGPRGGPDRHFRGPARAGRRCRRSRH